MMKEIKNYEGRYSVTDEGQVWSHRSNKFLKPNDIGKGYLQVTLYNSKTRKSFLVHRIVADEFVDNPNNYTEINHRNGNKFDNTIGNLEWFSRSENMKHAHDNRLAIAKKGEEQWYSKLTDEEVIEIKELLKISDITQKQIAELYGVSQSNISIIKCDKGWKHI